MKRLARFLTCAAAAFAISCSSLLGGICWAAEDGAYGRLDGDLEFRLSAGPALITNTPVFAARTDALYLCTAGIYAAYTDAFRDSPSFDRRSIAAGIRLAPLFLGRFALNREQGPARLDLLLDSIALDIGAFVSQAPAPEASFRKTPGLELGLGVSLPFFEDASALFLDLRAALRWNAAQLGAQARAQDGQGVAAMFSLTLSWHQILAVHLVDANDAHPR